MRLAGKIWAICGWLLVCAAGSFAQCLSCHKDYERFLTTAHHLTSREAAKDSIAGRFTPEQNILETSEPELRYRMEARPGGFFQPESSERHQTVLQEFGHDLFDVSRRTRAAAERG